MNIKAIKTMERVFKGVSNHWRIRTLLLIDEHPNLTLKEIVGKLKANYHTIGEHVRRLKISGLVYKKYKGKFVIHSLTPYGEKIVSIIRKFKE